MSSDSFALDIQTIVEKTQTIEKKEIAKKPKKTIYILDVSGSTNQVFLPGVTILEKEEEVLRKAITHDDNKRISRGDTSSFHTVTLYHFSNTFKSHNVNVVQGMDFIDLPPSKADGGTYTHLPMEDILKNVKTLKPDCIHLFTDGETHSDQALLMRITSELIKNGVSIKVTAVSMSDKNLETITIAEQNALPGMDLVNRVKNNIKKLSVYNRHHHDVCFEGAKSTTFDKTNVRFLGVKINTPVSVFLNNFVTALENCPVAINWGEKNVNFMKCLTDIGVFISRVFVTFPIDNFLIDSIVTVLNLKQPTVKPVSKQFIFDFITYVFNQSKAGAPIVLTNLTENIKLSVVKKAEFADAVSTLKSKGTTLGSTGNLISVPYNGICVIGTTDLIQNTYPLNSYPKSCDKFGNVYFDPMSDPQAIRIGLREAAGKFWGFPNPQAEEVIFWVASLMSLLYIKGLPMDSKHMDNLRKLAIIQTMKATLIEKGKYSDIGCFLRWQNGEIFPIHFSQPTTHTSCYKDQRVNMLKLDETIWWALMMSMLGIFDQQLHNYSGALTALGIELNETSFLEYIRRTYEPVVVGTANVVELIQDQESVISLCPFEPTERVFILNDHRDGRCRAKTWYSEEEVNDYVVVRGCLWCNYIPTKSEFTLAVRNNPEQLMQEKMAVSTKLGSTLVVSAGAGAGAGSSGYAPRHSTSGVIDVINAGDTSKKFRINLFGITGSGKSTTAKIIKEKLAAKGIEVLIVSSDDYSKRGIKGKQQNEAVKKDIFAYKAKRSDYKVIVFDLCNDRGASDIVYAHTFSDYKSINIYPNCDVSKFDLYEAWCLNNVLSRPKSSATTDFWLNPVEATCKTCIEVHNTKARGIHSLTKARSVLRNFDPSMTIDTIKAHIEPDVKLYVEHLATKSLSDEIEAVLTDMLK